MPDADVWSSIVSVHSTAAGDAQRGLFEAVMVIDQPGRINAEGVQDRRVQVLWSNGSIGDGVADRIRFADGRAAYNSSTGKPS